MDSPPPALQPPPGNPRFPLLDSMRAVAAISVLVTHAAATSNFNLENGLGVLTARLDFGVTIFFLLSGFLLYRPFVAARREGRPAIRARDFARRRFLRIVPAYWVALTVLSIYPGLPGFSDHWLRLYTFTQIYFSDSGLSGIAPAWTLCIEVTFYLVLPFLAAGITRLRPGTRGEIGIIVALCLASIAFRQIMQMSGDYNVLQSTLLGFFDWFGYGMILAVVSVHFHGRERQPGAITLITRRPWVPWAAGAAVFVLTAVLFDLPRSILTPFTDSNYLAEHIGYALTAVLLLLPAIFGDWAGGWPRRLLALRWMAWLGLISYGLYLWHLPILSDAAKHGAQDWLPGSGLVSLAVVAFALAVPVAAASYYLVERPALRFKDPRKRAKAPRSKAPRG